MHPVLRTSTLVGIGLNWFISFACAHESPKDKHRKDEQLVCEVFSFLAPFKPSLQKGTSMLHEYTTGCRSSFLIIYLLRLLSRNRKKKVSTSAA